MSNDDRQAEGEAMLARAEGYSSPHGQLSTRPLEDVAEIQRLRAECDELRQQVKYLEQARGWKARALNAQRMLAQVEPERARYQEQAVKALAERDRLAGAAQQAEAEAGRLRAVVESLVYHAVDRDNSTPEPNKWICLECYGKGVGETPWGSIVHGEGCDVAAALAAVEDK